MRRKETIMGIFASWIQFSSGTENPYLSRNKNKNKVKQTTNKNKFFLLRMGGVSDFLHSYKHIKVLPIPMKFMQISRKCEIIG